MASDVTIEPPSESAEYPAPRRPNVAMLQAMADIAVIHKDMHPKDDGKDSIDYLKEAREGAMYGE